MEGKRFGWPLARVVAELRPGPSSARSFTRPRLSRHERACRGMHPKAGQDEFSLGVTFFFQLQHLPSLNPILQFRYPSETFSTIDALLSPLSLQTHLSPLPAAPTPSTPAPALRPPAIFRGLLWRGPWLRRPCMGMDRRVIYGPTHTAPSFQPPSQPPMPLPCSLPCDARLCTICSTPREEPISF